MTTQVCKYCKKQVSGSAHYCQSQGRHLTRESDGDFLMSAIIGAATDSALLGGLLGGDMIGGAIGDLLNGDLMD